MHNISLLLSQLGGVILLLACAVLWVRTRTPWALVAVLAQCVSMLFRLIIAVDPAALTAYPELQTVWSVAALTLAIGLLGHAITVPRKA